VVRTLAWFQNSCALNAKEPMQALLAGALRHGIEARPGAMDADAAVIWSVLWAGRMRANQVIYEHYRRAGKPVIVIDIGALHRGRTWKIAVNHVTAQGYYGHQENLDYDRPAQLGIKLQHTVPTSPAVLICSQHAQSLQMSAWPTQESWIESRIAAVRQHTDRPIIVRPHPRSTVTGRWPGVAIQIPQKLPNTYDSFDMDLAYHAVVNHNSGPGIQAALAGTSPIVDVTSLAAPVSISLDKLEDAYTIDRQQWLVEIAHTEYTVPELASGQWVPRIAKVLND
jgi:hypothetical protein